MQKGLEKLMQKGLEKLMQKGLEKLMQKGLEKVCRCRNRIIKTLILNQFFSF
jgi:flagellar biosynthesis/type III secretory pathway protein FliH